MADEKTKADTSDWIQGESLADRSRRLKANKASKDTADAEAKAKYGSTAGKDLGSKGKSGVGMPKQEQGETPAAYAARLRKWREENDTETQARKKALNE